jgi:Arc/MetJ-type ribon-helix-helix transcriptional regulator
VKTVRVPTRFSAEEIAALDQLVSDGLGANRSEVVRLAVHNLVESTRRRSISDATAQSYRDLPQTDEEVEWAMANANALTGTESW